MTEKKKRSYVRRTPLTDSVEPMPGQVWVSRDPRDHGRTVTVEACEGLDGVVSLVSACGRKSKCKRVRFTKNYSLK